MAKEKSTIELKDEKSRLKIRTSDIVGAMRQESRQASDAENTELGTIQARMVEINQEIQEREFENRSQSRTRAPSTERFSLRRAIVAHMSHQPQHDTEARAIEEARKSHSSLSSAEGNLIIPMQTRAAYTATTEAQTGVVIDDERMDLLLPLEANLVLAQAGARMLTGLKGNIYWPKHSATHVTWEGENASANDGKGVFTKGTLFSPKRLTAYVDISKQLLIQENIAVEGLVRQLMTTAISQKLDKTAFSKAAHVENMPDGMFCTMPTAVTGAIDWAKIVEMETSIDCDNALMGNLAYIMHPALFGKSKTKVKDASGAGGFVIDTNGKGSLNGYKALRTNNIPKELQDGADEFGVVFGNWADYFIGQWGAMDITIDPYTQATEGMIRLVINSYWNMGMIRPESFCVGSLK